MNAICYEQAFNEPCRLYLKLAELFAQIEQSLHTPHLSCHQRAIEGILQAVTLLDRPDFKSKLIKELNRLCLVFHRLVNSDRVDQEKLIVIITKLEALCEQLHFTEGKLSQHLRDNDFLSTIRTHQSNPGGGREIPAYQLWLAQANEERQKDLQCFFNTFKPMPEAMAVLLSLFRDSALFISKIAERGFFQMSLDPQLPLQLLRIQLPKQTHFFPETSIGRHGISIRFYPLQIQDKRRSQTDQDIVFKLSICAL